MSDLTTELKKDWYKVSTVVFGVLSLIYVVVTMFCIFFESYLILFAGYMVDVDIEIFMYFQSIFLPVMLFLLYVFYPD